MKKKKLFFKEGLMFAGLLTLVILISACTKQEGAKPEDTALNKSRLKAANTANVIIDDVTLTGDACGHGTEAMDWGCTGANPGYAGVTVPSKNYKGEWWQAMTNWGQVYIKRGASQAATNTRIQIRNVTSKLLYNNGTWQTVQSGAFGGSAYLEDFANNTNKGPDVRDESNNEGGLSVIVGEGSYAGYNYHWYTSGRAFVDVNTVVGMFTTCEMRLIKADSNGTDDRDQSKYIALMGADWWLDTSVGWLPDWSANSGIGGGRWKYVTNEWTSFNWTSQTPAQTLANPPIAVTPPPAYATLPGTVEAENYSAMSGIATENCSEGGKNVGWIDNGDWMDYQVNPTSSGSYTLEFRVASQSSGGSFDIKSGSTVLGSVSFGSTGGWQNWTTVSKSVNLNAGNQTIRLAATSGGWNFNRWKATNVTVTSVAVSPTSASIAVNATQQLTATVSPSNATNQNVSWSSNNTSVASVDGNGLVTGNAAGNANITVTTQDGGKTSTCAITVTSGGIVNMALNKTATASSVENTGTEALKAFDGNTGTRWASNMSDPQWIYVDLGATKSITRVKLNWETAYGKTYKIQVSDNASSWTDIYSTTTGNGGIDDLSGLSGTGRYVRMYGTARGTGWGYSLWEFEVY